MLGNWSFGDYFKEQSIPWGWELSTEGFGLDPERIWVTVFEGDEELRLGPDAESIEIWRTVGVPDERIVQLPRSENFWQAGPTGPVRPLHRALSRPRRGVRRRRRPSRRRHRPLHRVLEPRLHDLRPGRGRGPQPAAAEQRRHRYGRRADGGDPPGRSLRVRDGRDVAAGGAGRGPLGPHLLRRRRHHPCDADPGRPLARHRRPDRRRSGAVERGPRLRAAADHAPGDPAGPRDRSGEPFMGRSPSGRWSCWRPPTPSWRPSARPCCAGCATRRRASGAPSTAAASCSRT